MLLAHGADFNLYSGRNDPILIFSHPFVVACLRGERSVFDTYLNLGVDVNVQDSVGRTPLHAAITQSNSELIEILLERGAKVNVLDQQQKTPLHYLATSRVATINVLKMLLIRGAQIDVASSTGVTPLQLFGDSFNFPCLQYLLNPDNKFAININGQDNQGNTLLHYAARKGIVAALAPLSWLKYHNANPNIVNQDNKTCLDEYLNSMGSFEKSSWDIKFLVDLGLKSAFLDDKAKKMLRNQVLPLEQFQPVDLKNSLGMLIVLPKEVMITIFYHLDPIFLIRSSAVSKAWRNLVHHEYLWRMHCCFVKEIDRPIFHSSWLETWKAHFLWENFLSTCKDNTSTLCERFVLENGKGTIQMIAGNHDFVWGSMLYINKQVIFRYHSLL